MCDGWSLSGGRIKSREFRLRVRFEFGRAGVCCRFALLAILAGRIGYLRRGRRTVQFGGYVWGSLGLSIRLVRSGSIPVIGRIIDIGGFELWCGARSPRAEP